MDRRKFIISLSSASSGASAHTVPSLASCCASREPKLSMPTWGTLEQVLPLVADGLGRFSRGLLVIMDGKGRQICIRTGRATGQLRRQTGC